MVTTRGSYRPGGTWSWPSLRPVRGRGRGRGPVRRVRSAKASGRVIQPLSWRLWPYLVWWFVEPGVPVVFGTARPAPQRQMAHARPSSAASLAGSQMHGSHELAILACKIHCYWPLRRLPLSGRQLETRFLCAASLCSRLTVRVSVGGCSRDIKLNVVGG